MLGRLGFLSRFGFAGRLMAIVLFALIALWSVGVGWVFVSESRDEIMSQLFPLPEQVTGIVELVETVEPSRRPAVLKAVSSENLRVTIAHERPRDSPDTRRMPLVERFLGLYLQALQPREVIAIGSRNGFPRWRDWRLGDYWRNMQRSLRFAVSLRSGDYLVFEALGPIGRRLFGWPPGFGVGVLGSLIGMAAVIAIAREARPLRALSDALGKFTGDTPGPLMEPAGAPEIRSLIISVNDMRARISELVRGRMLLLGAISHDLKTYITRLRLRAEQLPDDSQRDKAVRDLDEMTRLLEDALAVARGGFAGAQRQRIDLRALLSGIVEDRLMTGAGLRAELGDAPIWISAEPVALRRLFGNLIDNALNFASHCVVRLRCGSEAVVLVDDDGPGIPEHARASVFDPFFRLDPSRSRSTGGSGLGLAIVKQIADAHGARISLATSPEGGLRAIVAFPLAAVQS
jgi:two-component system, OmpR family, osmolarity sensor histidine kinase EnvZ